MFSIGGWFGFVARYCGLELKKMDLQTIFSWLRHRSGLQAADRAPLKRRLLLTHNIEPYYSHHQIICIPNTIQKLYQRGDELKSSNKQNGSKSKSIVQREKKERKTRKQLPLGEEIKKENQATEIWMRLCCGGGERQVGLMGLGFWSAPCFIDAFLDVQPIRVWHVSRANLSLPGPRPKPNNKLVGYWLFVYLFIIYFCVKT